MIISEGKRRRKYSGIFVTILFFIVTGCSDSGNMEKPILLSEDYASLSGKLSFGSEVISCKWELAEKREDGNSLFLPSKYIKVLSGTVVVSVEEAKKIHDSFVWEPAPKNEFTRALSKYFANTVQVLYSESFQRQATQKSPYNNGIILFDVEQHTFFFYLTTI